MKHDFHSRVEFEYTDNLPSFSDICMERAIEMRDMGKEIDIFYSGGIDSTCILLCLYEVCPKDQLHVIMGSEIPKKHNPNLWEKRIKDLHYTITENNLSGQARPDKNLLTTGCEADVLFGSIGCGMLHKEQEIELPIIEKFAARSEEEHYKNWWETSRHIFSTKSFRYVQNVKIPKMDMSNYQPFFFIPEMQKHTINAILDRNVVWFSHHNMDEEKYLKAKMDMRNMIAKLFDKDWAYSAGKTYNDTNCLDGDKRIMDYHVKAIKADGTIISAAEVKLSPRIGPWAQKSSVKKELLNYGFAWNINK
jgi:hypothetical protein